MKIGRFALFATLLACRGPTQPPASGEETDVHLEERGLRRRTVVDPAKGWVLSERFLSMWIDGRTRDGRSVRVARGARMRSGESVVIHLALAKAGYVYVIQIDSLNQSSLLYPGEHEDDASYAGTSIELPPPGELIELDNVPGWVSLVVVASGTSIGRGEAIRIAEQVRKARIGADPGAAAQTRGAMSSSRPKPPARGFAERGLIRKRVTGDEVFDVAHDEEGMAAVEFTIHHIP